MAGFAWPLCLLIWVVAHPQIFAQTLTRYGVAAEAVAPIPHDAPLAVVLAMVRQASRFSGITGRVSLYWYFFDPAYLFLTGGYANVVNSTRHVGVFPLPFIVLVPVGLAVLIARRRSAVDALLVAAFASAPLAACLVVPEPHAIDRELELLPFGVLAATAGAYLPACHSGRGAAPPCAAGGRSSALPVLQRGLLSRLSTACGVLVHLGIGAAQSKLLARERQHPAPAIYPSTHHIGTTRTGGCI
jgi:hypothetical protein